MEIRRIEPELITPPPASEHGARVENERRKPPGTKDGKGHQAPERDQEKSPEDSASEGKSTRATVYQADGHVHDQPASDNESHIDYTA